MPMYEYTCDSCGHNDTLLEKHDAAKIKDCPSCGEKQKFKRQLSAPSFQLKGTGWYVTDFKDSGKKKSDEKPSKESDTKPAEKKEGDTKTETKSDTTTKPKDDKPSSSKKEKDKK